MTFRCLRQLVLQHARRRFVSARGVHSQSVQNYTTGDLKFLVKNSEYGAAERVRLELLNRGIDILQDRVYEQAAIAALSIDDPSLSLAQFSSWFLLIPDRDHPDSHTNVLHHPFYNVRHALFHTGLPSTKIMFIIRYGYICAAKGYVRQTFPDAAPFITRYSNPTAGARYLDEIEQAALRYEDENHPGKSKSLLQWIRAASVEACCHAGWLSEAVGVLQKQRDFAFQDTTYQYLLNKLRNASLASDSQIVQDLRVRDWYMRQDVSSILPKPYFDPRPSTTATHHTNIPTRSTEVNHQSAYVESHFTPSTIRANVAFELSKLKRSIKAGRLPSENILLGILKLYNKASQPVTALHSFRKRALRMSPLHAYVWLIAEARLHISRRDYPMVLSLMTSFFLVDDLPVEFRRTLKSITTQHISHPHTPHKLKKHSKEFWLLIKAIIRASTSLPQPEKHIKTLYSSFIRCCSDVVDKNTYLIPFSSFIFAFSECNDLPSASAVLDDMASIGITPDSRHYSALAGVYARTGDVGSALRVLDGLEIDAELGRVNQKPSIPIYGLIMEGFIRAGLVQQAIQVRDRMVKRHLYTPGINDRLDNAIETLRSMEQP